MTHGGRSACVCVVPRANASTSVKHASFRSTSVKHASFRKHLSSFRHELRQRTNFQQDELYSSVSTGSEFPSPVSLSLWGLCTRGISQIFNSTRGSAYRDTNQAHQCRWWRAAAATSRGAHVMSNARQCFDDPRRQICVCLCANVLIEAVILVSTGTPQATMKPVTRCQLLSTNSTDNAFDSSSHTRGSSPKLLAWWPLKLSCDDLQPHSDVRMWGLCSGSDMLRVHMDLLRFWGLFRG